MWSTRIEELAYGRAVTVDFEKRPVKFSEVLRRWQDDPVFRAFFIALLADAPFFAFRWETPADYQSFSRSAVRVCPVR